MAHHVQATITSILDDQSDLQRVLLQRDRTTEPERAFVVTELTGRVAVGDRVLANVTAVELSLGTGGWHVVSVNLTRGPFRTAGGGHIMKLRYTPMQLDTGAAAEHLDELPDDLTGTTVVACTLHSQVPLVALGAREVAPDCRIGYVMTDGAALPLAFSGLVVRMRELGLIDAGTVTAGHAFGGDHEAVGIPDALCLSRHLGGADLIIVAMGPGVVGTGHRLATTALEAVPILDFASALGAQAVCCVRGSDADQRHRHRGLSHHSASVLDLVRSQVNVPVPPGRKTLVEAWDARHRIFEVDPFDARAMLDAVDLEVTTMGRSRSEDPLFFDLAISAGIGAASIGNVT